MAKEIKYLLYGIPILFIIGSLFHFFYDFFNQNILIGLIAPVNESIWEHNKLIILPMVLYFVIYYFYNKNNINKNTWFLCLVISLIISTTLVPMLYYTYTESLGFESLIIDILILLFAIAFGQIISIYIYKIKIDNVNYLLSILIIIFFIVIYMIFTVYTPKLPIFYSENSESYGIKTD